MGRRYRIAVVAALSVAAIVAAAVWPSPRVGRASIRIVPSDIGFVPAHRRAPVLYPLYLRRPLESVGTRDPGEITGPVPAVRYTTPVRIGQSCYRAEAGWWLDHDVSGRFAALAYADALIAHATRTKTGLAWPYPAGNRGFGASPGWISGMGQGIALACLAGAYQMTGETPYLKAASSAFHVLTAPQTAGGTATSFAGGSWFEEVAGDATPAHILNGMVFALGGVWTLNEIAPRKEYARAFRDGVRAVRNSIGLFTGTHDSLYDVGRQMPAPLKNSYNLVHVEQMQWLGSVTGDPAFTEAALRFMGFEGADVGIGPVAALSSDASAYWDDALPGGRPGRRSPLNIADGSDRTGWSTRARHAWLLVDLAAYRSFSLRTCNRLPPKAAWSDDLRTWTRPGRLTGGNVRRRARFLRLSWAAAGACVAEIRGR